MDVEDNINTPHPDSDGDNDTKTDNDNDTEMPTLARRYQERVSQKETIQPLLPRAYEKCSTPDCLKRRLPDMDVCISCGNDEESEEEEHWNLSRKSAASTAEGCMKT